MTTQEGLPALATDEEIAELRKWAAHMNYSDVLSALARLEAAECQVEELTEALDTFQEPKQFSAAVHRAMAHYHSKCAEKIDGKPYRAALEAKSHDD